MARELATTEWCIESGLITRLLYTQLQSVIALSGVCVCVCSLFLFLAIFVDFMRKMQMQGKQECTIVWLFVPLLTIQMFLCECIHTNTFPL